MMDGSEVGGRRDTGSMSNRLSTAQVGVQDPSATWEIWDVIRTMCGYNPRLSLSEPFSFLSRLGFPPVPIPNELGPIVTF